MSGFRRGQRWTRTSAPPDLLYWRDQIRRRLRQGGWYSRKRYPHFDTPLPFDQAALRVTDPDYVRTRSFLPFLGYTERKRRFSSRGISVKERPIKYCSHVDGYIHSYYAMLASKAYENLLQHEGLSEVAIAYRSGIGTNINMAGGAFLEIRRRGDCTALALDIASFFDHIDHEVLLANLKRVLNTSRLPDHWFAVYKSMTRFAWVEIDELVKRLGLDVRSLPRPLCIADDLRSKVRPTLDGQKILNVNMLGHGIPQGSPISAVFSNIYMIDFDKAMADVAEEVGGYYRRYSDDILFVCPDPEVTFVKAFTRTALSRLGRVIRINEDKTATCRFWAVSEMGQSCDKALTYLGFTYDGRRVLLRGRILSRYYRRMSYATRHTAKAVVKGETGRIYKRKLLRQFSHLGKSNLYSYARDAAAVMGDDTPKRQLRKHWQVLNRKLETFGK